VTNRCEKLVRNAERILRTRQIATYWKIPNDLRLTADAVVFGERGPCDFIGHTARGVSLLIEAKGTVAPRLAVPHNRGIKGHQWMALRDADAANAIAIIAWLNKDRFCALSFKRAKQLLGDRKSIPWPDGHSLAGLKDEDATIVVVGAIVTCIETHCDSVQTFGHA